MAINNIGGNNPYIQNQVGKTAGQRTESASNATSTGKTAQQGGQADNVNLSEAGKLRGAALSTAMSASDVRSEKVSELRDKVRNGTYQPDFKKAASNLLREESAIFQARGK